LVLDPLRGQGSSAPVNLTYWIKFTIKYIIHKFFRNQKNLASQKYTFTHHINVVCNHIFESYRPLLFLARYVIMVE